MGKSNEPREVVFQGDHPAFVSGKKYTYKAYSDGTAKVGKRVAASTMKGRLAGKMICTPRHVAPVGKCRLTARKDQKVAVRAAHQPVLLAGDMLSDKWLKRKL